MYFSPPSWYCWFSPVYCDCISLWQEIIRSTYSTAIQPHPLPVRWRTVWLTAASDRRHSPSLSWPGHLEGRRVSGQAYCSWYTSHTGHAHWAFPVSPWSCRWTFSAILQNGDRWCITSTFKILNKQHFDFKDRRVLYTLKIRTCPLSATVSTCIRYSPRGRRWPSGIPCPAGTMYGGNRTSIFWSFGNPTLEEHPGTSAKTIAQVTVPTCNAISFGSFGIYVFCTRIFDYGQCTFLSQLHVWRRRFIHVISGLFRSPGIAGPLCVLLNWLEQRQGDSCWSGRRSNAEKSQW